MKNKLRSTLLIALIISVSCFFYSCGILNSFNNSKPHYLKTYKNWAKDKPSDSTELIHTVYLIGDAGQPRKGRMEPTLKLLRNQIYERIDTLVSQVPDTIPGAFCSDTSITCYSTPGTKKTVIFLGDNIYYQGLPEEGAKDRKEMERRITDQMDVVKDFKGNKYFIPGNHDWDEMSKGGLAAVNRQEKFVEEYLGSQNVFLPSNGCPGPVEIQVGGQLVVILMDSEWWLFQHYKPMGPENNCFVEDKLDLTIQLQDIINRNKGKHILICQHHPLMTNGNHGGYYTLKDYLFPLTLLRTNLYIPLPFIGSIYPLMRRYGISTQDVAHPDYQDLINSMLAVIENEKNIVFAAGHEHNLQLAKHKEINHIVSGSGCKDKYLVKGHNSVFTHNHRGFAKINYYSNGEAWVEYWIPKEDGTEGELSFKAPLYSLTQPTPVVAREDFECRDSTKIMAAEEQYQASAFKEKLFGSHYRKEWATPIKVHYLDLNCVANGLTPVKKGGGNQTASLRLISNDSIQYTLRQIDKDPATLLPEGLRKTFAETILQDQMSSGHPYGPMIIPPLSEALNLFHTKPELYYVPHSPLLGSYIDEMGGKLAFLEIRPDEDLSQFKEFGYTKNAISTRTMFETLQKDNKNQVDQKMFLKARLFDMIIGDWDRHKDQWRWAEFKSDEGKIYKPIPRDRDQAFVKYDGIIPSMIAGKGNARNLTHFSENFDDVAGLNLSGSILDRTLLTELTLDDWIKTADSIKLKLTDEIIENAVHELPDSIFNISGEEIIKKLKSRRDQILFAAVSYYRVISDVVEITGSNKKELIKVERLSNTLTKVTVQDYRDNKPGEITYQRIFKTEETKEIIMYAFKGDDEIYITGKVDNGIKIRVIGGEGNDIISDSSQVLGLSKKTIIYDSSKEKNQIILSSETKSRLSAKKWIHEYDTPELLVYKYNKFGPKLSLEYNEDDGIFLGGGLVRKTFGFRKDPAKTSQTFIANYATSTGAYNIRYKGDFYSLLGKNWDLSLNGKYFGPNFTLNYFGEGNETSFTKNIDFYRTRISKLEVSPFVNYRFSKYVTVGIAPTYELYEVINNKSKFINDAGLIPSEGYSVNSYFIGSRFFSNILFTDDEKDPTRGAKWKNEISYFKELKGNSEYTNLNTDFAFYITPVMPFKMTVALRVGAATNIGEYKFFQANFLGQKTNLRGYRSSRFSGRSSVYQNTEVRFRLFDYRSYLLTAKWGLLGFVDQGRVWADGENSKKWHVGYGPGIWFHVYNILMVSGSYGFSEEDQNFRLQLGFFF